MNKAPMIDLIDDDPSVLRALARLIRALGFSAREFGGGADFLDAERTGEADCIILDMQMPEISGLELYTRLRLRRVKSPVIFITAHEDPQAERLAMLQGAAAFLYKPLRRETLCAAIEGALRAARRIERMPEQTGRPVSEGPQDAQTSSGNTELLTDKH